MENYPKYKDEALYKMECFSALKNNLQFVRDMQSIKSILITSTKDGEGKTTIALSLGIAFAKEGSKTLIIDANTYNPSIKALLGLNSSPHVMHFLKADKNTEIFVQETPTINLYMLSFEAFKDKHLQMSWLQEIFSTLTNNFDYIIIDSPSSAHLSVVQVLSQISDGCLMVMKPGQVDMSDAKRFKEQLIRLNANIIGAILNKNIDLTNTEEYVLRSRKSLRKRKESKHRKRVWQFHGFRLKEGLTYSK